MLFKYYGAANDTMNRLKLIKNLIDLKFFENYITYKYDIGFHTQQSTD